MSNEHRSDDHSNIPTWDGNPSAWTTFSNEVKLWRLSENLEVNFSLASRLVRKLSGSARRAVASLGEEQLHPAYIPEEGQTPLTVPADQKAWRNKRGIENVMAKLLQDLGQQKPVRKGESLYELISGRRSTCGGEASESRIGSRGLKRASLV